MEVTFMDLLKIIVKRWWIVLMAVVLGTVGAYFVSSSKAPSYVSQASLLAQINGKETNYSFGDLNYIHASIPTYIDIMNSDSVYDAAAEIYNEENGTELKGINIKSKFSFVKNTKDDSQSLVFYVECIDGNKEASIEYLNCFIEAACSRVNETITTIKLNAFEDAHSIRVIREDVTLNTLIGAFIGLLVGLLAVFVINALDSRIRDAQEITDKHNVPVIGIIPNKAQSKEEE